MFHSINVPQLPIGWLVDNLKARMRNVGNFGNVNGALAVNILRIFLVICGLVQLAFGYLFVDAMQMNYPWLMYIQNSVVKCSAYLIWYFWLFELCMALVLILIMINKPPHFLLRSWIILNSSVYLVVFFMFTRHLVQTLQGGFGETEVASKASTVLSAYAIYGMGQVWAAHKYSSMFMYQRQMIKQRVNVISAGGVTIIIEIGKGGTGAENKNKNKTDRTAPSVVQIV